MADILLSPRGEKRKRSSEIDENQVPVSGSPVGNASPIQLENDDSCPPTPVYEPESDEPSSESKLNSVNLQKLDLDLNAENSCYSCSPTVSYQSSRHPGQTPDKIWQLGSPSPVAMHSNSNTYLSPNFSVLNQHMLFANTPKTSSLSKKKPINQILFNDMENNTADVLPQSPASKIPTVQQDRLYGRDPISKKSYRFQQRSEEPTQDDLGINPLVI